MKSDLSPESLTASHVHVALVLELATLGSNALVSTSPDIKDGSVDHGRVEGSYGLPDVVLQLVEGGRAGVVDQ